jgi:hypothetical protein
MGPLWAHSMLVICSANSGSILGSYWIQYGSRFGPTLGPRASYTQWVADKQTNQKPPSMYIYIYVYLYIYIEREKVIYLYGSFDVVSLLGICKEPLGATAMVWSQIGPLGVT